MKEFYLAARMVREGYIKALKIIHGNALMYASLTILAAR